MSYPHSQKRKRSNESLGEYQLECKKMRYDDVIDLIDFENNENDVKDVNNKENGGMNIENISGQITSKVFKSRQKSNFMHAIWKIDIPSQKFYSNFQQMEVTKARGNIDCMTLLAFNYSDKEFYCSIQIGHENNTSNNCLNENHDKSPNFEFENKCFNPEEIKLSEFLHDNSSRNGFQNLERNNSPTMSLKSNSPKISGFSSSDDKPNFFPRNNLGDEIKLKLDLENKSTNTPIKENSHQQMEYIRLKSPNFFVNEEKSFNEEANGFNLNSHKLFNENTKKSDNQDDEHESFNVSINICIAFNKFMNFSLGNLLPGEIRTQSAKISDETFAQLTNQPHSDYISRCVPSIVPIVIQIDITKNLPNITKYMGMINEGTTCYMNSILQSLNFIGYFKKAVFQIPLNTSEDLSKSVTYSLQKIFYDLMTESKPISTLRLIKSFGWSKEEMLIQHDVQEFNLTLSELMENNMKGTKAEGTFKYLFEGRLVNYIQCLNVDYKSIKEENFHDLQLTVKGCRDIYESLDKYTEEEILDDDNKYDAERYGKQVAKKGVKFLEVPKVLMLQLKRFEYNFQKDSMEKVNDYFEFFNEINLSKYITDTSHSIDEYTYSLHSVLVHAGFPTTGHYYAYIKPEINSRWIKFNDEDVKYADEYEVFENNFGGDLKVYRHTNGGKISKQHFKSDSNSYILIYIKNKVKEVILKNVFEEDIPLDLKDLFKKEKLEEKKQILEDIRKYNNIDINLFSREIIVTHQGLGLTNSDSNIDEGINFSNIKNRLTLNVPKEMKIIDFIEFLSMKTKIPPNKIKLFNYILTHPNLLLQRFTYFGNHIGEDCFNNRIRDICDKSLRNMPLLIYVHIDDIENHLTFIQEEKETKSVSENSDEIILQINNLLSDNLNSHKIETQQEEYVSVIVKDDSNQVIMSNNLIYYSKKDNYWNFKENSYNVWNLSPHCNTLNPIIERKILMEPAKGEVLCVIKYLNLKQVNEDSFESTLSIGDIVTLNKFQTLSDLNKIFDFKEKYKKYLDENVTKQYNYEKAETEFLIEYTSLHRITNKRSPITSAYVCKQDTSIEACKNSVLCVLINLKWNEKINLNGSEIDSFKKLILDCCDNLICNVYIKFNYLADKKHRIIKSSSKDQKIKFKLNQSESETKIAILNKIKSNGIDKELIQEIFGLENPFEKNSYIDYYVYSIEKDLLNIYEFFTASQANIIDLVPYNDDDRDNYPFYKEYPTLRYLHKTEAEYSLLFALNYIPNFKKDFGNFYNLDFVLFDIDNNFLSKINLCFPQNISKFSEILDYMKRKNIISKFYENDGESKYSLLGKDDINNYEENINLNGHYSLCKNEEKNLSNNFFFILQNPETKICYDLIFDCRNESIKSYESKPNLITYRIQPYPSQEVSLMDNNNKLFFSIVDADLNPVSFPLCLFFDKFKTTVISMKQTVLEKLKNIKCLMSKHEEDFNSRSSLTRIKFYTFVLINFKPRPHTYIHPDKDNSFLSELNAMNILVKLPSGGNSNLVLKHG